MDAIERNGFSQAVALRMHYLPDENNSEINLARALWLDKHYHESLANSVASGISKCF